MVLLFVSVMINFPFVMYLQKRHSASGLDVVSHNRFG